MRKSKYLVLAVAMLSVAVMPIAVAGAAGKPQATVNANLKKQIRALSKRLAALEGRQDPVTLPPSGPAGGDLTGSFPTPQIKAGAVGTTALADGGVLAADLGAGSVGASALKGVSAVAGVGVTISAGTPKIATVTCPAGQRLIGGGFAWTDKEANSIITNAPSETNPNGTWEVEAIVAAGSNNLFPWATCLAP